MLQSPKGMNDILPDRYYQFQGFFEKAQEIAVYYGFRPIETPILEQEEVFSRGVGKDTEMVEKEMYTLKTRGGDHLVMRPEGTAPIMRAYLEQGMQSLPQPVMLYYYGPFFRHDKPQRGRFREFRQFGVEILGASKSIADAIIIRTIADILAEVGFDNISVDINSIGDNECRNGYIRSLVSYYKKNLDKVCADCRKRISVNPLRVLDCKNEACAGVKSGAPEIIGSLCHGCKTHFKEVLEYLEAMGIPYKINNFLVRGLDYYSRTVFEIFDESVGENGELPLAIASGGRYDYLAKNLGSRKPVSATGGAIGLDRLMISSKWKPINPRIIKKPKVCFIQLGFEAKLKSLAVIEILRKAKIPIAHSLPKDSLIAQLAAAEKMAVPYTIIFGQKEAMEGTVIVRNMEDRSQETIKIENLPEYIKKIKS